MTSINFNAAASSALRTLQSTNASLDATQNRVSTGLKIGEAKDNAAYWSISTTLKSDNKALGTVKDALNLGAATVDVAYQGLNESLSVLNEIKSKLMAATSGTVDRGAVQRELVQLQDQLRSIAQAATFAGENWLNASASNVATKEIISGFNRDGNNVTLRSIEVDTSSFVLTNATGTGLLEGSAANTGTTDGNAVAALFADNAGAMGAFTQARTIGPRDVIRVNFDNVGGTPAATGSIQIDQSLVNKTLNVTDGRIRTAADLETVIDAALTKAGLGGVTTTLNAGTGVITFGNADVAGAGTASTRASVLAITGLVGMSDANLEQAINAVNAATDTVTAGATTLGAAAKRIELQKTFVTNLMDTIDKGVSGLIDADMNEESTKLQALQVKQQLGVQALSIANQSAQNVLSLFRG